MRLPHRVATALAAALLASLPALGAEYWVDQKHEAAGDANPGTPERPWRTVGKAAATLQPGDTVRVRPGIYREAIVPKHSGTAAKPITYRAEGSGVVLSGADALAGWKRATPETCPGNPHHGSIWYTDAAWMPSDLFLDGKPLRRAREPNRGWWIAEGGGTHTLADAAHLAEPAGRWLGSTVFFWDVDMTTQGWRRVVAFDPKTHTLTLEKPIYRDRVVEPGRDRYFVEGKLEFLDRPGEFAVTAYATARVFLWPPDGDDPNGHLVEAPRRSRFVLEYGNREHLRIDGFEVRHGAGHGIGSWTATATDIAITQCDVHHNQGNGLYVRSARDVVLRGNLVRHNSNGVTAGTVSGLLIEANEIADNDFDGLVVSHQSDRVTIRRNFIHGHNLWGHPDNIQFHNGVTNLLIEDNVILDAGQALMMEQCEDGVLRNNVIVGAAAYAVICGHRNVHRFQLLHNTIAFTGYGTVSFTGTHYTVQKNLLCPGGSGAVFSVANAEGFASDHNLLFKPPGAPGCFLAYARNWPGSFEAYRKLAEHDAHSLSADPRFVNAPVLCVQTEDRRLGECTASKLLIRGWPGAFEPGDHVEVKFDGVVRTVKAADKDHIVVDPPLDAAPEKGGLILNWKDQANYALDLRLRPDSPAREAGLGADLDIQAFARGDVDGDGKPDIRRADEADTREP